MRFIELDRNSPKFGKVEYVNGRRPFLEHVKKKQTDTIKKIIAQYGIVSDVSILSRWSLVNVYADICVDDVAEQLLKKERT